MGETNSTTIAVNAAKDFTFDSRWRNDDGERALRRRERRSIETLRGSVKNSRIRRIFVADNYVSPLTL